MTLDKAIAKFNEIFHNEPPYSSKPLTTKKELLDRVDSLIDEFCDQRGYSYLVRELQLLKANLRLVPDDVD